MKLTLAIIHSEVPCRHTIKFTVTGLHSAPTCCILPTSTPFTAAEKCQTTQPYA